MQYGLKVNSSTGTAAKNGAVSTQPVSLQKLAPLAGGASNKLLGSGLDAADTTPSNPLFVGSAATVSPTAGGSVSLLNRDKTTPSANSGFSLPIIVLPPPAGGSKASSIKNAPRNSYVDKQFTTPTLNVGDNPFVNAALIRDNSTLLPTDTRQRNLLNQLTDNAAVIQTVNNTTARSSYLQRLITPRVTSPDRLDVTATRISNGEFKTETLGGISSLRPEIISLINFKKVYDDVVVIDDRNLTAYGKFLSIQAQLRFLRQDTLNGMREAIIANPDLIDLFQATFTEGVNDWKSVKKNLDFFTQNFSRLNELRTAFNITEISAEKYAVDKFLPLDLFFQKKMQYSRQSFESFTDSKLLGQLLIDYRAVLEKYSFNLLNVVDTDRIADVDPITYDTSYATQNGFSFSVDGLRGQLSFKEPEFTAVGNSLPAALEDKIKLLIVVLSKELRVSKGLTKSDVRQTLKDYYQAQNVDGVPFDNIIGAPGNDIFSSPLGVNSLSSLLQVKDGDILILPWEQKVIDDTQTTYVPGTKYFIDTILDGTTGTFNTQPVKTYAASYSEKLFNAKKLIEGLFEFSNQTGFGLSPFAVYSQYLASVRSGAKLLSEDTITSSHKNQLILLAILQLAAKNKDLKYLVFQYLLLNGIATFPRRSDQKFFQRISDEIKVLQNLPGVDIPQELEVNIEGGFEVIFPYLEKLAEKIEATVNRLLGNVKQAPASSVIKTANAVVTSAGSAKETQASRLRGLSVRPLTDNKKIGGKKKGYVFTGGKAAGNGSVAETITDNNGHSISIKARDIKDAILSMANANGLASSNLFKEYIELCYKFDQLASIQGNELSYTTTRADISQVCLTRFNQLTSSTLALLVFETLTALVTNFLSGSFYFDNGQLAIVYDVLKNTFVLNTIDELVPPTAVATPVTEPTKRIDDVFIQAATAIGAQTILSTPSTDIASVTSNTKAGLSQAAGKVVSGTSNKRQGIKNTMPGQRATPTRDGLVGPDRQRFGSAGSDMLQRNPLLTDAVHNQTDGVALMRAAGAKVGSELLTEVLGGRVPTDVTSQGLAIYGNLRRSLYGIKDKLLEEDLTMENFMHILEVIGDNLSTTTKTTTSYFESFSTNEVATVRANAQNLYATQLRTCKWIYDSYDTQVRQGSFSGKILQQSEVSALFSLLREPLFRSTLANNRLKLIAVGVPYGLTDKLLDRVAKRNIDRSTIQAKQADLIRIAVHKKTAEDEDVVFYPKNFTFDMSLYPIPLEVQSISADANFDSYLREYSLADYTSFTKVITPFFEVGNTAKYDILSAAEKRQMAINHVVSQLLQLFSFLTTGSMLDEGTFPLQPYTGYSINPGVMSPAVTAMLQRYLIEERGVPVGLASTRINELLTSPTLASDVKDDLKLFSYGASIINSLLLSQKVLSQKKFDRVFIIPINVDDFIIDEATTKTTTAGIATVEKASYQTKTSAVKNTGAVTDLFYFNRSENPNALIFDDYFVTIESIL